MADGSRRSLDYQTERKGLDINIDVNLRRLLRST